MNVRNPNPPTAEARITPRSGSARRRATPALSAFAPGELPLGERPPGAPAGRGVRIFVIEYGGNPADPHVQRHHVAGGSLGSDLGQGMALTPVIRRVAPAAEVFAVRIFGQGAATTVDVLEGALEFALRSRARVVNLRAPLALAGRPGNVAAVCRRAARDGAILVSSPVNGMARSGLSGVPPEVIGAVADARLGERSMRYVRGAQFECRAAGLSGPHATPPQLRDWTGHGLAAARVSGVVACILEARPRADLAAVRSELHRHFSDGPHRR